MTAAAYGTSRAVAHNGMWNQVHASASHAAKPIVASSKGENTSLIAMAAEMLKKTIGQAPPEVLSQTVSAQSMYPAAASPTAHGSSPNTSALDFASCGFNQRFIGGLPDGATARRSIWSCLHAKDVRSGQILRLRAGRK